MTNISSAHMCRFQMHFFSLFLLKGYNTHTSTQPSISSSSWLFSCVCSLQVIASYILKIVFAVWGWLLFEFNSHMLFTSLLKVVHGMVFICSCICICNRFFFNIFGGILEVFIFRMRFNALNERKFVKKVVKNLKNLARKFIFEWIFWWKHNNFLSHWFVDYNLTFFEIEINRGSIETVLDMRDQKWVLKKKNN